MHFVVYTLPRHRISITFKKDFFVFFHAGSQAGFLSAYLLRQSQILSVSVGECCLSGSAVKWNHMAMCCLCLILVILWQVFCCLLALRNPIPVHAISTTCYPERSWSLAAFQSSELLRLRSEGPLPGAHHIVCWTCWKRGKEQFDFQILGWVCFYNCWCHSLLTCQLGTFDPPADKTNSDTRKCHL